MAKKSPTGSHPPAVPLAITPTFRPWTHTSDDSYFCQLSLVVATTTVSFIFLWCRVPCAVRSGVLSFACLPGVRNENIGVTIEIRSGVSLTRD